MILQDGEEEEEGDSSEEEASSEEEEKEEEDEADDRPEDDRIEADRVAPPGASATNALVAAPALVPSQEGADSELTESAGPSISDMTASAVVGSEMTESTDPACVTASSAERETSGSREVTPAKSEGERSSNGPDESGNTSAVNLNATADGEGDQLNNSSQTRRKNKSSFSSSASKKIVAEHKKAVRSASSRLAEYIKAPLPPAKPKEEKKNEHVTKKNHAGNTKTKKPVSKAQDNSNVVDTSKGDALSLIHI